MDDSYTVLGYAAGATGIDTIVNGIDTAYVPAYDSLKYGNVVLVGHNVQPTNSNQVVLGDTTIMEVQTSGNYRGKGYQIDEDSLYLNHLILDRADSFRVAVNYGDSVHWSYLPIDSISNDTIYIREDYLKLDQTTPQTTVGTFTFPKVVATTDITTPLLIGGSAVDSKITYKSTTGAGTTSGIAHQWLGRTNGETVIATMLNNGSVGIGTTEANSIGDLTGLAGSNLQVYSGTSNGRMIVQGYPNAALHLAQLSAATNDRQWRFLAANSRLDIGQPSDNFSVSNTIITLIPTGNVGILQTNPAYTLDVTGNGRFTATVKGADAVLDDEFVTLGQITASILDLTFISLEDTPDNYPAIDKGNGLIASDMAVHFSDFFGSDTTGFWVDNVLHIKDSAVSFDFLIKHDDDDFNNTLKIQGDGNDVLEILYNSVDYNVIKTHGTLAAAGPFIILEEDGNYYQLLHDASNELSFLYVNEASSTTTEAFHLDSLGKTTFEEEVELNDSLMIGSGSKIGRSGTMAEFDFWTGTQSEYDALGSWPTTTIYYIID
jgi:hypothetical protein